MFRKGLLPAKLTAMMLTLCACGGGHGGGGSTAQISVQDAATTATPIKHLVVIFGENRSFDHYFGTYPNATNPSGEPAFTAAAGTPSVNGLTPALLNSNPNVTNASNVAKATAGGFPTSDFNPFRIDRAQANTADQSHSYTPEQLAEDNGLMDAFPANTGSGTKGGAGAFGTIGQVMGYFDGNTVTAMWNYAQTFAMNDNAYTNDFGPSTPGALGVVAGTTNGAVAGVGTASTVPDGQGGLTLINDTDPAGDTCSSTTSTVKMTSKNIGDLLNAANISWGGFMGGFNLSTSNANGTTACKRSTFSTVLNASSTDYVPHHAWFQYYATTSNPTHARPTSTALIGFTDPLDSTATPVHHQYDVNDFMTAVTAGNFPSVSYIKAPSVSDAHPGNSDPLDEQFFVANLLNFLQQQPDWKNTAVIITYDDSDGWYDHRFTPVLTSSADPTADQLTGKGSCTGPSAKPGVGVNGSSPVNGRCGPGTRIPFLVISPWAKSNFVDDTLVTQASVIRFIEDNWLSGQRLGGGSDDATAGSIMNMFDFSGAGFNGTTNPRTLFVDTGQGTKLTSPPAITS
ncbi:MAG: alkaline phosphatase family protein [Caulobacteraceae bacterium]